MANQIQLKGGFRHEEGVAAGTIYPGMLIEIDSAGEVQAHSSEGGYAERAFAIEDALQGNTVSDYYSADDVVSFHLVEPGAEIQAMIESGQNLVPGDKLISAGNGKLIKNGQEASSTTVYQIIAVALEECDLSDSDAVDTLANVRVV